MVDWHRNTHPTRTGGEHIPAQPLWITIIRGIQFLFNLLVLALAANAASYWYLDGYGMCKEWLFHWIEKEWTDLEAGMAFFTFVWTVLFLLYIFLAPRFAPHLYHFWAHVALEVLTVIWWLVTMALLAHYTRVWSGYYGYWRGGMADSTRAATAFAVLNWLLFIVTLAAILFLSRRATIDATHTHTTTTSTTGAGGSSFGAKFSSLFARKPRTTDPEAVKPGTGTELGGGPVHNGGAPTGTNDYGAPYGNGQTNATGTTEGYGQHWQGSGTNPDVTAPPPAAAPHYGEQPRY